MEIYIEIDYQAFFLQAYTTNLINNGERTSMSSNTKLLKTEREFGKMIMIIILLFVGTYFPSFLLRAVGTYFTNLPFPRAYV